VTENANSTGGKAVTYDGPTEKHDPANIFVIDGVELPKGQPIRVTDENLLKELSEGSSERIKGHKFTLKAPDKTTLDKPRYGLGGGGAGGTDQVVAAPQA
jgi:hypothetical protein